MARTAEQSRQRPRPPAGRARAPRVRPWGDALALFALALVLRLPFQTSLLYHWDSVLYARALADFDVSESRPHPPGYLFYVALARLAQLLLGDANASLVAVSLVGGALAVALVYLLGRQLYGRGVGLAAALLLATAPSFWFYSGVAYPYTLLACGSVALAGLALLYWRGRWPHPALLGLLYGLAGGFRLDLLIFLAPLLAVAHVVHCRRTRRPLDLVAPLPGAIVGTLLWLVPTAWLSQGWGTYWPLLWHQGTYVEGSYSLWSRGWPALQSNSWQVLVYAWEGLLLAVLPLAYGAARSGLHWWRGGRRGPDWSVAPAYLVLFLWLAPPALFYALVHIGDRGYSFSLLPGLCVGAAAGGRLLAGDSVRLWRARRRRRPGSGSRLPGGRPLPGVKGAQPARKHVPRARAVYASLIGVLLGANLAAFLFDHSRVSAYEMDCVNRTMAQSVALVREQFDPADTLIFSSFFYQHARHYLPGFRAWWHDPLTRPVFREPLPAGVRRVVIFGEGLWAARQANVSFYPLACNRRLYYFFNVEPNAQIVYRPPLLSVRPYP